MKIGKQLNFERMEREFINKRQAICRIRNNHENKNGMDNISDYEIEALMKIIIRNQ